MIHWTARTANAAKRRMVKVCEAAPVLMRLALRQRLRDTCVLEKRTTGGLTARRDRRSRCGCEAVNKLCNNAASEAP